MRQGSLLSVFSRGRDAGCPAPPAQTRARDPIAHGSHLGEKARPDCYACTSSRQHYSAPMCSGTVSSIGPCLGFSLADRLPSTRSAWQLPASCSHASLVLCSRSTPQMRSPRTCALGFSERSATYTDTSGVSRFSRMESPGMPGASDCAGFADGSRIPPPLILPSDSRNIVGTPDKIDFAAQYPACLCPCPTLRLPPCGDKRMARGQDGSLFLSRRTLSFLIPCRFIPAHLRVHPWLIMNFSHLPRERF